MSRLDAVVFDLDGVLLDSEERWDAVRRGLAADAGLSWPAGATHAMLGMNTAEWSAYLAETVGIPAAPEDIATTVIDRMAAGYAEHLPLLPGAVDAVQRMAGEWPLGLASSSPRRLIDAALAAADITEVFRATVATDEVGAGKPSPAVYLRTAELLGTDPERTAAVEDSSNGLRSAARAGLLVVAVPNPAFPPDPDALALATGRISGLAELVPGLLEGLAAGRATQLRPGTGGTRPPAPTPAATPAGSRPSPPGRASSRRTTGS
jgi:HAD superfamily hydrolase (TIGR01509 family)